MTSEHYTIRTVEDFLKVPADRRDLMLQEFGVFLGMAEHVANLGAQVGVEIPIPDFVWIDDDESTLTVNFNVDGETVAETKFKMGAKP